MWQLCWVLYIIGDYYVLGDFSSFAGSFSCGNCKRLVLANVSLRIYGVVGVLWVNALDD